jgi:hypothetical protein
MDQMLLRNSESEDDPVRTETRLSVKFTLTTKV